MLVTPPVRRRERRRDVVLNVAARRLAAPYQSKLGDWHSRLAMLRATAGRSGLTEPEARRLAAQVTSTHQDFREELVHHPAPLVDNSIIRDVERAFEQLASSIGALR